ncbi:hypothetical protein K435DRAFT_797458 [Dendrothele bispora CBS 962.96]|uniref:Uncharacterized protein n=1 Tax=Dendrothele bispora (strain CBS 962.96) TaxID=1314807 RepID=A0A4S8M2W3_DENBC|nr:hypothetical protein K435DRAFT_797458 [Dendrothele bispora CBS 962.96]
MSLSEDSQQRYSDFISLTLPLTFYALLYVCIYIIVHRQGCVRKLQIIAIVALFAIATLGFIFSCISTNLSIKGDLILAGISSMVVSGLYILANIIADIILIHRCFKIWGSKKKVIALPVFIAIFNNVTTKDSHLEGFALAQLTLGILRLEQLEDLFLHFSMGLTILQGLSGVDPGLLWPFLVVNFFTNLLIPLMIGDCQSLFAITKFDDLSSAGRIWWIGRQVSKFLHSRFNPTRHSIAVCLESGIMYPLALIPALVINLGLFHVQVFLIPILIQVVGIAPTFIIVRVALGISIESVQGIGKDVTREWKCHRYMSAGCFDMRHSRKLKNLNKLLRVNPKFRVLIRLLLCETSEVLEISEHSLQPSETEAETNSLSEETKKPEPEPEDEYIKYVRSCTEVGGLKSEGEWTF